VDGILTLVEYHNTLLSQPIESIDDMPEDVLKILKKAKFKNLEELVDYSEYWLLNNDLIGKRNIKKVNQFLKAKRLMLRDFTPAES
jgi:DNA-directed RNA polymerase alpha subunit